MRIRNQPRSVVRMLVPIVAVATLGVVAGTSAASAEGPALPGMCNGSTSSDTVINAQAHSPTKFILNVATDEAGVPSGVLIVGKGATRIYVDQICRVWQHVPGQVPEGDHDGETPDDGATIAHAVGVGSLSDGTKVLVRADVRETEEGAFFRARYRVMGEGGHEEPHDASTHDEGAADEEWVRVPAEGWAPLHQFNVRVVV